MMRLRVTSIAPSLTKDKLVELFEEIGDVESIKVFRTLDNTAVAMALIEMKRDREGQEALTTLNGFMVGGTRLRVELSQDLVRGSGTKVKAAILDDDEEEEGEPAWKTPSTEKPSDPAIEDEIEDELGTGSDDESDDDDEDNDDFDDDDEDGDEDDDDDDDEGRSRRRKEIPLDELDEEI